MKVKNWLLVILIAGCLAVFFGYRAQAALREDRRPPEIKVTEENPVFSVSDPTAALTRGLTASDDRDGDVTGSLVVEDLRLEDSDGTISVTYAAFDRAGNVKKLTRKARFADYEDPRFVLTGPLLYHYGLSFDVLSTVGAVDALDGDIQHRVRALSQDDVSIASKGTHMVQFQVTNSLGAKVTQVFPVEVYDADAYNASLTLKQYLLYLPLGEQFNPKSYLDTFTYAGETVELGKVVSHDYSVQIRGTVRTDTPGTYPVEYRVTYSDSSAANRVPGREYTGYSKLIVIVEG